MQQDINDNLKKISTWKRILFILVFSVIVGFIRILLWTVILLQIASALFTGSSNQHILDFSRKLSAYLYHILLFLTFNTDDLPFPFSDWSLTEELEMPKTKKAKLKKPRS
jgi:cytoskeletal protein RodZ